MILSNLRKVKIPFMDLNAFFPSVSTDFLKINPNCAFMHHSGHK